MLQLYGCRNPRVPPASTILYLNREKFNFEIEMWNPCLEEKILNYVRDRFDTSINIHQVSVIPFEWIKLVGLESSKLFQMSPEWRCYRSRDQSIQFTHTCASQSQAEELVQYMRQRPRNSNSNKFSNAVRSTIRAYTENEKVEPISQHRKYSFWQTDE